MLQDHFNPPLSLRRHWHAFHNAWATFIASDLNRTLPEGFFAEPNVQFGIEIDVAALEESTPAQSPIGNWKSSAPTQTLPIAFLTDVVEILVFSDAAGPVLAGAIELVSPSNKDRPRERNAFVSKCAAYLEQGVGLVIIDVVTNRIANLHNALLERLETQPVVPLNALLYAVVYRPVERDDQTTVEIWQETLEVGEPLPTLPLWLRGGIGLPIELAASHDRTCREQRLSANGV